MSWIIPFGKFKNTPISDIEDSYLKWAVKNITKEEWKEKFQEELDRRDNKNYNTELDTALSQKSEYFNVDETRYKLSKNNTKVEGKPLDFDKIKKAMDLARNKGLAKNAEVIGEIEIDGKWHTLVPDLDKIKKLQSEFSKNNLVVPETKNDNLTPGIRTIHYDVSTKPDPLIFGKDQTHEIVNVTVEEDGVYLYKKDGSVEFRDYKPWIINSERKGTKLKGNQFYNYIKHVEHETYDRLKSEWSNTRWLPRTKEEGFMLLNGVTYYKGLKVEDISLLSFDIETTGVDSEAEDAKVLLISNTFRRNGKIERKLFDINDYNGDDIKMLADWCLYVTDISPDVCLGHNILGFDLSYMNSRIPLHIGRDGSYVKFDEKESKKRKDGQQSYSFHNATVHGREIIDTLFLSLTYDVSRLFSSYGLKAIEKHLKLVDENRIEWDFKKHPPKEIYKQGGEIWEQFKEYCRQDSDSPIKLFDLMIPSLFYAAQSIPKTLQQMVNEATGSQLDAIMIRSYLQDGYSLPKSSKKEEFEGAISMGSPGVYENTKKVDCVSMYPSIMLQYEIYDKQKDPNKNVLKILNFFRNERINNKNKFKETGDKYYDDLQGSMKISINSMFGLYGSNFLLFNYPKGASEITRKGREILQKTVRYLTGYELQKDVKKVVNEGKENEETQYEWNLGEKTEEGIGYTLVSLDTDGVFYTNGRKTSKKEMQEEIEGINSNFPEYIRFEEDGIYDKVIVVKAKNYVMKKGEEVKYKGSGFKSSNKEPALKELMMTVIDEMLGKNREDEILKIYKTYCREALNIKDITRWSQKKTVTKKMKSEATTAAEKFMSAVEEAVSKGVAANYSEGDKFLVYQAKDGKAQKKVKGELQFYKDGTPKLEEKKILRVPELWSGDHDVNHYLERCYETVEILGSLLPMDKIKNYGLSKNSKLLSELNE